MLFLLSLLSQAQTFTYFPRQPSLPPSIHLSIKEEDTDTFTRAQLHRINNSLTSPGQTTSAYFEGDILGVTVQWNTERVGRARDNQVSLACLVRTPCWRSCGLEGGFRSRYPTASVAVSGT